MLIKRLINSKFLPIILVLALGLPSIWPLLKPGYFSHHDDVQVMRLLEMQKCFQDLQLPCRWVPDMGAGYGHPLYNFHPVFSYYFGMIFRLLNFSFIDTSKILFGLTLILSGIFMYLFTKEFFGRVAGIVAAIFLIYAPYHAVDIYVRGAMTESWGIVFFPLIFLSLYKYVKEEKLPYFILSILSLSGLFLSHNIMSMLFTPIAIFWTLLWMILYKKKNFLKVGIIFTWTICLSSFFVLPAFFEKNQVQIDTLTSDYYDFHNHFATFNQLFFSRIWGYGPSRLGTDDDLSFQIGWPHWWIVGLVVGYIGYAFIKSRKQNLVAPTFFILVFFLSALMTHARSVFIWDHLPVITFTQFPWRFLSIVILASAFLVGFFVYIFKGKTQIFVAALLIALVGGLNIGYFRPEKFFPDLNDQKLLSGNYWKTQSMATLLDYMPIQVRTIPKDLAPLMPSVDPEIASISAFTKNSNSWEVDIKVSSATPTALTVPIFDFPVWVGYVDDLPAIISHNNDQGLIEIMIPPGDHIVKGKLTNTLFRTITNIVSLVSIIALFGVTLIYYKRRL